MFFNRSLTQAVLTDTILNWSYAHTMASLKHLLTTSAMRGLCGDNNGTAGAKT
jgi:hypothetical protein